MVKTNTPRAPNALIFSPRTSNLLAVTASAHAQDLSASNQLPHTPHLGHTPPWLRSTKDSEQRDRHRGIIQRTANDSAIDRKRQAVSLPTRGAVFGNFERRLPPKRRGYYREFTVATPGPHDRGARRIVIGENGECYYTEDHYRTFRKILKGLSE